MEVLSGFLIGVYKNKTRESDTNYENVKKYGGVKGDQPWVRLMGACIRYGECAAVRVNVGYHDRCCFFDDDDDRAIHAWLKASSGVIRRSGSHCRQRLTKSIKLSSVDLSAWLSGLVPGRRLRPLELGLMRGKPFESIIHYMSKEVERGE